MRLACVRAAHHPGLDRDQVEAAVAVVAMFNYFTRVADATGIEFDYETPLPAFEPDVCRVPPARPSRSAPPAADPVLPRAPGLRAAWAEWRRYVTESDEPLSRPDRQLLAATADADLTAGAPPGDGPLVTFAAKLSRRPWTMQPADLQTLRDAGHSETAILHAISVVAHQNATTRLHTGLTAHLR